MICVSVLFSKLIKRRIMMRILITGACGFIGSQLAKKLSEKGHKIIANDIQSAN
jgi:NAD(P)-dependent dehydrogenase (short-subunit alcohol dehydrogenase family)